MLRKCLQLVITPALLAVQAVACGYPDGGLMSTALVDGHEASQRINGAAITGSILCAARRGTAPTLVFSEQTDLIYGVDAGRAYKEGDVKKCEENIKLTTAVSGDCNPTNAGIAFLPACKLTPVDKVTGS